VCERCGHPDDARAGYMLTVHHLNGNTEDSRRANLAALCQRCHLHIQNITLDHLSNQLEMFEPFELLWLDPHLYRLGLPVPKIRQQYLKGG